MNAAPGRRLAALTGLMLAAAVAFWWIGSTRLALDNGSDASRPAAGALNALWLVRAMALALLGLRVGASSGWRPAAAQALVLCAPSWLVVTLAWAASTATLAQVVLAECMLLAAGLGLALVGQGLRRAVARPDLAQTVATGAGAALAATVWATAQAWMLPLP